MSCRRVVRYETARNSQSARTASSAIEPPGHILTCASGREHEALLLVAALLIASSLSALAPASRRERAADPPSGALIACGRGTTVGPTNCMTLQQAIDAATPIMGTVTIDMMPGEYCPPTLPTLADHGVTGTVWTSSGSASPLTVQPVRPADLTGEEAELTSFKWDASCGGAENSLMQLANPGGSTEVGSSTCRSSGPAADRPTACRRRCAARRSTM